MDRRAFKIIDKARSKLLSWSRHGDTPIHRVEFIASFEEWSKSLGGFVFYERDADVERYAEDGTSKSIEDQFLDILKSLRYPFAKFPEVDFVFDSHERVEREYEGSYYFRTH